MHVDIDQMGIHLHIEHDDRKTVFRQIRMIGIQHRFLQMIAAYHPPVDEQKDEILGGTVVLWLDRHAAQTVIEVFSIDLDRALGHAAVIHLHQDLTQIAAAFRLKDGPAVMAQRKADLWIGERKFLHDIRDQRKLILRRLQMLETRRGTLKQMLDANARSQRTRSRASADKLTVTNFDRAGFAAVVRLQKHMGYGSDRRQGLPAKPHRMNVPQIIFLFHLAGGVTLKGRRRILCVHPFPVIGDRDAFDAALHDIDRDRLRLRIDAVFDQLFYDPAGPLHHFTGGDHIA